MPPWNIVSRQNVCSFEVPYDALRQKSKFVLAVRIAETEVQKRESGKRTLVKTRERLIEGVDDTVTKDCARHTGHPLLLTRL
jgi:hypothetical protein